MSLENRLTRLENILQPGHTPFDDRMTDGQLISALSELIDRILTMASTPIPEGIELTGEPSPAQIIAAGVAKHDDAETYIERACANWIDYRSPERLREFCKYEE